MQLRSVQTRKRALPFLRLADASQRGLPGPAAFLPVPVALVLARSLASSSAPRACPALPLPGVPTPPHRSRDAWSFGSQLQCAFPREATQPPHLKLSPTTTRRLWRPTAVWHRPAWVLIVRPPARAPARLRAWRRERCGRRVRARLRRAGERDMGRVPCESVQACVCVVCVCACGHAHPHSPVTRAARAAGVGPAAVLGHAPPLHRAAFPAFGQWVVLWPHEFTQS